MSCFHLYQKVTKNKEGVITKVWYYWYLGPDGARVRRSTGCSRRHEAEDFIESLEAQAKADEAKAKSSSRPRARLREIADPMFKVGAAHLVRWEQKGRKLVKHTVEQHRRWIDLFILPKWGDTWCDEITGPAIEDWLITLTSSTKEKRGRGPGLANTTKNCPMVIFESTEPECYLLLRVTLSTAFPPLISSGTSKESEARPTSIPGLTSIFIVGRVLS